MKKLNLLTNLVVGILISATFTSCEPNKIEQVQGVYSADKESLKAMLSSEMKTDNAFANKILEKAIDNAVIEFKINGDSINGLIFIAGQTSIISSKIELRNDSLVFNNNSKSAYISKNEKGLTYKPNATGQEIQLLSSDKKELSAETKEAIEKLAQKEKEQQEFNDNLGKWQLGGFVDEFGDKTGEGYPYVVVRGSHENSAVMNSDVIVKAYINAEKVRIEIYNGSMTLRETFPSSEFGTMKIKLPNGDVTKEKIFFYKNTISESPDDDNKVLLDHLMNKEGELKILIDLSTASRYYSDKYQFTLSKANLSQILNELN